MAQIIRPQRGFASGSGRRAGRGSAWRGEKRCGVLSEFSFTQHELKAVRRSVSKLVMEDERVRFSEPDSRLS